MEWRRHWISGWEGDPVDGRETETLGKCRTLLDSILRMQTKSSFLRKAFASSTRFLDRNFFELKANRKLRNLLRNASLEEVLVGVEAKKRQTKNE